jgi:hypothetical protein
MECQTLTEQQESQIEAVKIKFLRAAADYRTDGIGNKAVEHAKYIYKLIEKIIECQINSITWK